MINQTEHPLVDAARDIEPWIIDIRRRLHRRPELMYELHETSRLVQEELTKLEAKRGVAREIRDAEADMGALPDEGVTWRLGQAAEARNNALRSQTEDKTTYEVADNGSLMDREERDALDALLAQIDPSKGKSH